MSSDCAKTQLRSHSCNEHALSDHRRQGWILQHLWYMPHRMGALVPERKTTLARYRCADSSCFKEQLPVAEPWQKAKTVRKITASQPRAIYTVNIRNLEHRYVGPTASSHMPDHSWLPPALSFHRFEAKQRFLP